MIKLEILMILYTQLHICCRTLDHEPSARCSDIAATQQSQHASSSSSPFCRRNTTPNPARQLFSAPRYATATFCLLFISISCPRPSSYSNTQPNFGLVRYLARILTPAHGIVGVCGGSLVRLGFGMMIMMPRMGSSSISFWLRLHISCILYAFTQCPHVIVIDMGTGQIPAGKSDYLG